MNNAHIKKQINGLTEKEAEKLIKEMDMRMRVVERDGEHFFGTMDIRTDRVNVRIQKGIVEFKSIG